MTKANKKGKIGSQRLLQVAVAQYPDLLHKALQKAGYDVLVFIASKEEDESKITCGNAILAEV